MTADSPRTFEGLALAHPDEPVYDQGLRFDLAVLNRRTALWSLGAAVLGVAAAGCSAGTGSTSAASAGASTSGATGAASAAKSAAASGTAYQSTATTSAGNLTEIPDETAGPYPGNGSNGPDVLEKSGVIRADLRSSFDGATGVAQGVPMTLQLTVLDIAKGGVGMAGAAVYVWHCDRGGGYSMYSSGLTSENYLRGVQIADAAGVVTFTSIFPGCYSGRWPHIHFQVFPDRASITNASAAIATSQVALPQDVCSAVYATSGYQASVGNLARLSLTSDNVFGNDGGIHQLGTAVGDTTTAGYAVRLTVPVDTRTAPTGGNAPGDAVGGGPGGPGGPGNPPPGGPMTP